LSVLVFAHELGHFFTARSFGVKAEEFGFGFPPRAVGWYKNRFGKWRRVLGNRAIEDLAASPDENLQPASKATIYSLNWLLLGGFVRIKGENGEGQNDKDSFAAQKIWRRAIILVAGVVMNVILAWFLFTVGYLIGMPQSTDTLGANARISQPQVVIAEVMPGTPAAAANLKAGDVVLEVEGAAVSTESNLQDLIAARANEATALTIKRADQTETINVTPSAKDGARATIGVAIYAAGLVHYPFFSAIWEGLRTSGLLIAQIVVALIHLIRDAFAGQNVGAEFAGPVGIATITGQAARLGFSYLLQFVALLSLNLAIVNFLPLPALDGGRLLFLLIEKIKGKPVKREVENIIHTIGFWILIALVLLITYHDVRKLF
jgi:regulator of sigma E protease